MSDPRPTYNEARAWAPIALRWLGIFDAAGGDLTAFESPLRSGSALRRRSRAIRLVRDRCHVDGFTDEQMDYMLRVGVRHYRKLRRTISNGL